MEISDRGKETHGQSTHRSSRGLPPTKRSGTDARAAPIPTSPAAIIARRRYREDETVPSDSNCPTFAMCVLYVNNERWNGVPFIVKAGKALNESKVEIRVQLRDVPGDLFLQKAAPKGTQTRNELVVRLQPDPSIYMKMTVKEPGLETTITQSEMELLYTDKYVNAVIPEAYERLILDCIYGDQQHFVRRDELQAAWSIFTPVLHFIDAGGMVPEEYAFGSRGPLEADELRKRVGHVTNIIQRDITWDDTPSHTPRFTTHAPLSP